MRAYGFSAESRPLPGYADSYATNEDSCLTTPSLTEAVCGSCNTVALCPRQRDVSKTICPVRKLKRVVMTVPQICVDLAETSYVVTKRARNDKAGFAPYVFLKGKLGARKQANSYRWLLHRGKPARDRVREARGY
jgi:hypothetical protein